MSVIKVLYIQNACSVYNILYEQMFVNKKRTYFRFFINSRNMFVLCLKDSGVKNPEFPCLEPDLKS